MHGHKPVGEVEHAANPLGACFSTEKQERMIRARFKNEFTLGQRELLFPPGQEFPRIAVRRIIVFLLHGNRARKMRVIDR